MDTSLEDRYAFAKEIALEAGSLALQRYKEKKFTIKEKSPKEYVTEVDLEVEEFIVSRIREKFNDDAIIAEETVSECDFSKEWIWVIDPIDGTRGFVKGTGEFAVHVGVLCKGKPVIGVVRIPTKGLLYEAMSGNKAYCNGKQIHVSSRSSIQEIQVVSSRRINRMPQWQKLYAKIPYWQHWFCGSMGIKTCLIAQGKYDLVLYSNGLGIWDLCAPMVVLVEAGGRVSKANGSEVILDRAQIEGKLVLSNGACHSKVLEYLKT